MMRRADCTVPSRPMAFRRASATVETPPTRGCCAATSRRGGSALEALVVVGVVLAAIVGYGAFGNRLSRVAEAQAESVRTFDGSPAVSGTSVARSTSVERSAADDATAVSGAAGPGAMAYAVALTMS